MTSVGDYVSNPVPLAAQMLTKLGRIGIDSIDQALLCVPRNYLDFSSVSSLKDGLPKNGISTGPRLYSLICSVTALLETEPKRRFVLAATDGMLSVQLVIFLGAGVDVDFWRQLRIGSRFFVYGSLQNWGGNLQMTSPILVDGHQVGKMIPTYQGKRGVISAETIQTSVQLALPKIDWTVNRIIVHFDGLSESEIIEQGMLAIPGLKALLLSLHKPESLEEGVAAIAEARKLAAFAVVWSAKSKKRCRQPCEESKIPVTLEEIKVLAAKLPKTLTNDQKRAIRDICVDLDSPFPMRRVLSGDVGCGKTYAYLLPAVAARQAGALVCILTPNSLLVEQFVKEATEVFGDEVPVLGVTGASKKKLDVSNNPILVGTTALLDRLRKQDLAPKFLVVDEQQKFSVEQKAALSNDVTNLLEATATPIPRTTALVTHGGMDVSIIRESPVVKKIDTHIVTRTEFGRLFSHTRNIIDAGGQVAVIYPIVDDAEQDRKSAVAASVRWEKSFPGKVGMIHGGMKEAEKKEIIQRLKDGELSVCISTTVIEIGLTLPSLKSVVVVHAERYGVSQLHQLRGRVARHGGKGYFFLYLPDPVGNDTMARMRMLCEIGDGFVLAEKDAQARGYGDLDDDADRQHGASRSMLFYGLMLSPEDIYAHSQER